MKSCEEYEIELSSFLDGEVWPAAAAEAVEHALSCAGCSAFFRAARRLQLEASTLDAEHSLTDEEVLAPARADALWSQVRARSAPPVETRSVWSRPLRAAALLMLGLGGGYLLAGLRPGVTPAQITAASAPGTHVTTAAGAAAPGTAPPPALPMDEHRFLGLATELLAADVRYQRAMLDVLRLVPALETGEGLRTEDAPRSAVRARLVGGPSPTGAI